MRISKIKKPLCAAMAAITVAASLSVVGGVSASAAATSYNAWGDVNMDGKVDSIDLSMLYSFVTGSNSKYFAKSSCYDYNHDGIVDTKDVDKLYDYVAGVGKLGLNVADFNDNGVIDAADAKKMLTNLFLKDIGNNLSYDFNGDRFVDSDDVCVLQDYINFGLSSYISKLRVIYDRTGKNITAIGNMTTILYNPNYDYIPKSANLRTYNVYYKFSGSNVTISTVAGTLKFTESELDLDGNGIVTKNDIQIIYNFYKYLNNGGVLFDSNRSIRYDVPLYYQGGFGTCWAYSSVMITDYFQNALNDGYSSYYMEPAVLHGSGFVTSPSYQKAKEAFVHLSTKKALSLATSVGCSKMYDNLYDFANLCSDRDDHYNYIVNLNKQKLEDLFVGSRNGKINDNPDKGPVIGCMWNYGGRASEGMDVKKTFTLKSKSTVKYDINGLYRLLSENGPLWIHHYHSSEDANYKYPAGHATVLTGVDVANNIVYSNNPWGVAGKQTFNEFMDSWAGCSDEKFDCIVAYSANPSGTLIDKIKANSNIDSNMDKFVKDFKFVSKLGILNGNFANKALAVINSKEYKEYQSNIYIPPYSYLLTEESGLGLNGKVNFEDFYELFDFNCDEIVNDADFYYLSNNYNKIIDSLNNLFIDYVFDEYEWNYSNINLNSL